MEYINKIYNTLELFPYNTQRAYKNALKEFLKFTGGILSQEYIQDYINYISKINTPASVRLKYYALKRIFKILNKPIKYDIILPRKVKKEPSILTEERLNEFYNLVNTIKNEQVRVILNILPRTGLRISELLNLTVNDIREDNGITYIIIHGKGEKERKVTLNETAKRIIYKYINDNKINGKLFNVTSELVRYYIRSIRKKLNIPYLTPHTLRHTFASILLQKGIDVKTISELLGHHSVIFTLKTYCHTTLDQKQKAVNTLK